MLRGLAPSLTLGEVGREDPAGGGGARRFPGQWLPRPSSLLIEFRGEEAAVLRRLRGRVAARLAVSPKGLFD